MYAAKLTIKINRDKIAKLEEMLIEKWNAENITFKELAGVWRISFVTQDNRKVFAFEKVVNNYGGTVLRKWITKIKEVAQHNARM